MSNQYTQSHCIDDNLEYAVAQTAKAVLESIDGQIDILFAFSAGHSPLEFDRCMRSLQGLTGATTVLGCTCATIIGGGFELEHESGLTVWAASIPDATITPMHLSYIRSTHQGQPTPESAIVGWPESTDGEWPSDSVLLVLGEPFGFPADILLERFNEDRPGVKIAGGMTSGAQTPGQSRLLLNDETFAQGAVAVRISGTSVKMLVSQGCRPIGNPMVITKCERNIIEQLGGKDAVEVVQELFQTLPTREQTMFQYGLQLGRVIDEHQDKFELGDFLVRNVVGFDRDSGSISIGDYVRPGQTVQFHIRDAESATVELKQMLVKSIEQKRYLASLLFTCNGRGLNLFPDPHHDANLVHTLAGTNGKIPLAGFFAAGEIGPIGNNNFLHGFTASVVLFE